MRQRWVNWNSRSQPWDESIGVTCGMRRDLPFALRHVVNLRTWDIANWWWLALCLSSVRIFLFTLTAEVWQMESVRIVATLVLLFTQLLMGPSSNLRLIKVRWEARRLHVSFMPSLICFFLLTLEFEETRLFQPLCFDPLNLLVNLQIVYTEWDLRNLDLCKLLDRL